MHLEYNYIFENNIFWIAFELHNCWIDTYQLFEESVEKKSILDTIIWKTKDIPINTMVILLWDEEKLFDFFVEAERYFRRRKESKGPPSPRQIDSIRHHFIILWSKNLLAMPSFFLQKRFQTFFVRQEDREYLLIHL